MTGLRRSLMRHPAMGAWLVAAALVMRILVPAGYMPVLAGGSVGIALCTGFGPQPMAMAMPGMAGHEDGKGDRSGKEMPCGFGGLAAPSLVAADPLLPVVAPGFVVLAGFGIAARGAARRAAHVRPPPRGPPTAA